LTQPQIIRGIHSAYLEAGATSSKPIPSIRTRSRWPTMA
jgi:hypothetical protein